MSLQLKTYCSRTKLFTFPTQMIILRLAKAQEKRQILKAEMISPHPLRSETPTSTPLLVLSSCRKHSTSEVKSLMSHGPTFHFAAKKAERQTVCPHLHDTGRPCQEPLMCRATPSSATGLSKTRVALSVQGSLRAAGRASHR